MLNFNKNKHCERIDKRPNKRTGKHCEHPGHVPLRLLLALTLAWSCFIATPLVAGADIRPDDMVAGKPLGADRSEVPDAPNIVAEYAALCSQDGTVLWERDAHKRVSMASTTKMMTALVALENVSPDTPMLVTKGAAYTEGSTAYLRQGDRLTLKQLVICMMLPSGNDASVAIAENVSGTEHSFVKLMNEKAQALGMSNTRFANASGLEEEGHYTTASDYLILTRVAMQNEIFREVAAMSEAVVSIDGRDEYYVSTNELLENMEGANGVKTGFTDEAGYCLVASAKRYNFEFYAVVFYSSDENQRFVDAKALLEWGFAHYHTVELINPSKPVADLACRSWIDKTVPVVAGVPVFVDIFDYNGSITQEVTLIEKEGSIAKGEAVGQIIWMQKNEVIAHVDLVATEDVPKPSWWERIKIWWKRFFGNFSGKPKQATSTTSLLPVFELR